MREEYQRELQLLAIGLIKRGMQFEFRDCFEGGQIIVYENTGSPYDQSGKLIREWDAVCHEGSYGRERGLLEIMGNIVDSEKVGDYVEGYLTAEEVLERVDNLYK